MSITEQQVNKMLDERFAKFDRRSAYYFDQPISFFGARPVGQQMTDIGTALNTYGLTVAAPSMYSGHFNTSATVTKLPTDWTISVTSGTYTITHNLGDTNYTVVATANDNAEKIVVLQEKNNNTFVLRATNENGSEFATAGEFIVIRYNN